MSCVCVPWGCYYQGHLTCYSSGAHHCWQPVSPGIPVPVPWTHLAQTATNGSVTLTLMKAVTWKVGDEIVIASTGHRYSQVSNSWMSNQTYLHKGFIKIIQWRLRLRFRFFYLNLTSLNVCYHIKVIRHWWTQLIVNLPFLKLCSGPSYLPYYRRFRRSTMITQSAGAAGRKFLRLFLGTARERTRWGGSLPYRLTAWL